MGSLFKSTLNTRALPLKDLRYIRSDLPYRLSSEEIKFLLDNNIRTAVDLRMPEEISELPCCLRGEAGFEYINLSVTGGSPVPPSVSAVASSYLKMLDNSMEKVIEKIEGSENGVIFFCRAGKDRTGVVSALLMKRLGFSDEEIIADYLLSAENLKEALARYAEEYSVNLEIITPQRKYMEEFLRMQTFCTKGQTK